MGKEKTTKPVKLDAQKCRTEFDRQNLPFEQIQKHTHYRAIPIVGWSYLPGVCLAGPSVLVAWTSLIKEAYRWEQGYQAQPCHLTALNHHSWHLETVSVLFIDMYCTEKKDKDRREKA